MPPSLFANKSVKVTAFWQQSWKLEPSCCVGSSLPLSVFLEGVFFTVNLRVTWLRQWLTNGTRGMWGLGKKHVTVNKERRRECKRIVTWEQGRRSEKMSGGWQSRGRANSEWDINSILIHRKIGIGIAQLHHTYSKMHTGGVLSNPAKESCIGINTLLGKVHSVYFLDILPAFLLNVTWE